MRGLTTTEVLAYLREHGRDIQAGTWSAYVSRGQAPEPVEYIGRTPLWRLRDIEKWMDRKAR
jgi:hypothetical protein